MKIAIPADNNSMETAVCISFGRTPYFLVYDSASDKAEFVRNGAADSQGGAGIKAAQHLVDLGVDVLVTPRCGENANQVLTAAGIKIFKTAAGSAMDNVHAYISGTLSPLNEIHAGLHQHGGN